MSDPAPIFRIGDKKLFSIGRWEFDPLMRTLRTEESKILLTAKESKILTLFCSDPNGMLSRDTALLQIWNDELQEKGNSLKVYISRLRKYFRDDPQIEILNVHGVGYRMVVGT